MVQTRFRPTLAKLDVIGRTYRHLARYQHIIRVFVKYGFGGLVDTLRLRPYLDIVLKVISRREALAELAELTWAERLRLALEELGPTFIKLGQLLSTRPDLVPPEFIRELARLQDRVPPFPYDKVAAIVEQEMGAPPDRCFASFDREPTAAASIAQGHRARTRDGEDVFVKVQRPNIRQTVAVDIEIMMHLASVVERHLDDLKFLKPVRIVEEFARAIEKEMNFLAEASHIARFAQQFDGREGVHVPAVFPDYTTERMLTLEYIDGIKASDTEALREAGFDLAALANLGAELLMEQFFVHGFFHADPHPGNIYILPGHVICYVDFGLVGRITRSERERFADLLMLVVTRDEHRATEAILDLTYHDDELERDELERDVADFVDQYFYRPIGDIEVSGVLQHLYGICYRHGLSLKPAVYLMMKALGAAEGFGRQWDPDFEVIRHAEPFVRRLHWQRFDPRRLVHDASAYGSDCIRFASELPDQLRAIFRQVREGRVKIEFEHRGLDGLMHVHERVSNQISSAIVIGSLIVGSSLMMLAEIPPNLEFIPILGFLVAAVLGLWLVFGISRSGK